MPLNFGRIRPCIGCGYCCTKSTCMYGNHLHPGLHDKICPELLWDGTRHVCKPMLQPGKAGEDCRLALYAGEGCCSNLNSWRREPLQDRTKI